MNAHQGLIVNVRGQPNERSNACRYSRTATCSHVNITCVGEYMFCLHASLCSLKKGARECVEYFCYHVTYMIHALLQCALALLLWIVSAPAPGVVTFSSASTMGNVRHATVSRRTDPSHPALPCWKPWPRSQSISLCSGPRQFTPFSQNRSTGSLASSMMS